MSKQTMIHPETLEELIDAAEDARSDVHFARATLEDDADASDDAAGEALGALQTAHEALETALSALRRMK